MPDIHRSLSPANKSPVGLNFLDTDAVHVEHQLPLDHVFPGAHPLGVLDHRLPGLVVLVDEVGHIAAGFLQKDARLVSLRRYEVVGNLLAEAGYDAGLLHELELSGAGMLLFRSMPPRLPGVVLVTLAVLASGDLVHEPAQLVNVHRFHCTPPKTTSG